MKPFLLTLLATLCLLAATAEAQTVKAVSFNTTNNTVVSTNRVIFPLLGVAGGTAVTPALTYTFGTNSFGTFASTQVGIGPFLGFSVEGARRLFVSTNTLRVEVAVSFSDTNVAATTRTNLGLGGGVITNIDVLVSGGGTNTLQFSNGILTNVTTP
jgi:hypothetical protein